MPIFKRREKKDFPVKLFVAAALANLFLVAAGVLIFRVLILPGAGDSLGSPGGNGSYGFRLKDGFRSGDPLLTKIPDYKDFIQAPIAFLHDPSLGKAEAPVVIFQFADYECQACQKNAEAIKRLVSVMPDQVRFVWKDLPESDLSSPTWTAALAARCADNQNKYWEYEKLLFENNKSLNQNTYLDIAKKLELNADQFKSCYASREKNRPIVDNLTEAGALDITGVPTIYINDRQYTGEISFEDLKKAVEDELKAKK